MEDIDAAAKAGAKELTLREGTIFTPSAREAIAERGFTITSEGAAPASAGAGQAGAASNDWERLFNSPEAEALKAEIIEVGRKLWLRQYVDGNGGNISCRLTAEAVICTPTLVSKADLKPQRPVPGGSERQPACRRPPAHQRNPAAPGDLQIGSGSQGGGALPPGARHRVRHHRPRSPTCVIPEYEVFIGRVALSPYETPGTQKFAETVMPFVKSHNTVLLANHGIVCWADSATHAEWYAEVVDTYCWTLMLASQLGAPLSFIPSEKTADLLAIKQHMGLPDVRADMKECQLCDLPEQPGMITVTPDACVLGSQGPSATAEEIEAIVQAVTNAVMASLEAKNK